MKLYINLSMMLQNKNSFLKNNLSTPSSRYYRSVRYKVNTSSVADGVQASHRTPCTPDKPNKTTFAWRKPRGFSERNSQIRNGNSTLNWSKNDANLNKPCKGLSEQVLNPQSVRLAFVSQKKVSYLETWDSLLHPLQKEKNGSSIVPADNKIDHIEQDNSKLTLNQKNMRVFLPQIIDFQPSMFTSLDPVNLPIQHIQRGIIELKKQLPEPKRLMGIMRSEMKVFRQKILSELEETKQQGLKGFQKLRGLLRADRVLFQEGEMRLKRKIKELQDEDKNFEANFQKTKPRLSVLQEVLFSNLPFELQRNQDLDEQFPQLYF